MIRIKYIIIVKNSPSPLTTKLPGLPLSLSLRKCQLLGKILSTSDPVLSTQKIKKCSSFQIQVILKMCSLILICTSIGLKVAYLFPLLPRHLIHFHINWDTVLIVEVYSAYSLSLRWWQSFFYNEFVLSEWLLVYWVSILNSYRRNLVIHQCKYTLFLPYNLQYIHLHFHCFHHHIRR